MHDSIFISNTQTHRVWGGATKEHPARRVAAGDLRLPELLPTHEDLQENFSGVLT